VVLFLSFLGESLVSQKLGVHLRKDEYVCRFLRTYSFGGSLSVFLGLFDTISVVLVTRKRKMLIFFYKYIFNAVVAAYYPWL
jgi:hypothetical protein